MSSQCLGPWYAHRSARRTIASVNETPTTDQLQLQTLNAAPVYWTAQAMQEQGSRFFQHLGAALFAADLANRRIIYMTWPEACWDFYQRGLILQAAQETGAEQEH